jgi:HPt (histidine-containing phosphotransfer) domain-containing protein
MTLGALARSGHGSSDVPAIDRTVLGEWLDGDDAAINKMLAVFYESIGAEVVRMRDLLALDDFGQFANAAHRLRGAALSMGARTLAHFAGLLFTAALARDRDACVNGMPVLAGHVQRVEAEVPAAGI